MKIYPWSPPPFTSACGASNGDLRLITTMVDMAKLMEMGEKDDDDGQKRKRKYGHEGGP